MIITTCINQVLHHVLSLTVVNYYDLMLSVHN